MCVYLCAKFQVSSIILLRFRQVILHSPHLAPQNKPLKCPPRLGLNSQFLITSHHASFKLPVTSLVFLPVIYGISLLCHIILCYLKLKISHTFRHETNLGPVTCQIEFLPKSCDAFILMLCFPFVKQLYIVLDEPKLNPYAFNFVVMGSSLKHLQELH